MGIFSGKTILITGATGLIGSHIVDAFMSMGDVKIIALSRNKQKLEKGFENYLTVPNFNYIAHDITVPINLDKQNIDLIFHAASPMESKVIANAPVDVIMPNLMGTINCFELLKKQEKETGIHGRLVLFSSVTVYGNMTDKDIVVSETDTRVTEALESGGVSYSQSKRMSEVIAQAYHKQYGIDAVIARLSTVYGNTRFKPDTAFFEFIDKAISGENIIMNNSGIARRDNIYIDDAVSGLLVISQKGIGGQAYNISSNAELGNFAAIDEIADIIAHIVNQKCQNGKQVNVAYKSGKNKERKPGVILDNSKLKSLGWALNTSLIDGIAKTIEERMYAKYQ